MDSNNDIVIEAWNTILYDKFCRFKHLLIDGLSAHSNEALERHAPREGMRVLDVGCGFGDSTRLIARRVGPAGEAVGVDCAERFIRSAQQEAREADIGNASFFVADVQRDDLRGPYDAVFSRFGTMFFNMPGAAMRNIRKGMRPGSALTMIVWRRKEDNPWLYEAEQRVREIVPVVSHEETDQVHCGPGPFSMAGADLVSSMLKGAGYDRIAFERFDAPICIGRTIAEGIDFAMNLGPAGEIIRLAGEEGAKRQDEVRAALAGVLAPYVRNDGVWGPSSTWFVTARNP